MWRFQLDSMMRNYLELYLKKKKNIYCVSPLERTVLKFGDSIEKQEKTAHIRTHTPIFISMCSRFCRPVFFCFVILSLRWGFVKTSVWEYKCMYIYVFIPLRTCLSPLAIRELMKTPSRQVEYRNTAHNHSLISRLSIFDYIFVRRFVFALCSRRRSYACHLEQIERYAGRSKISLEQL